MREKNDKKKIEQEAKNDAQDKQEVEKRRKLQLLMLYNQYLRKRMDEQLKKYEELEFNYEKIRDILGTQDLEVIINFIMERNKRYNYSVQVVEDKEHQIKLLKKEIKNFKSDLVKLKNEIIVNEKESNSKTETTIAEAGMDNEEEEIINLERAKNEELLILGKKHNEINLAYNQVLSNIKGMQDYDQMHPLDIKEEEKKEEEEEKEEEPKEEKKGEDNGNLTPEEEECIKGYEALLKKILKAFNILYLCKSKQEFMNLMREKGINQQGEIRTNKMRNKTKKGTKRGTIRANKIKNEDIEVKKNNEGDEEDDFSNYDPDKNILARFIKEQKKEIDDFVNVKKVEVKKPVPNK